MFHVSKQSVFALCAALAVFGCSKGGEKNEAAQQEGAAKPAEGEAPKQAQTIEIDGSSTVFPITQAVAEEFEKAKGHKVTIGMSGTGGGFKKFCRGEIVIAGASRPIKDSEREACAKEGIEFIELPVAYDGLTVVVHKENTWVDTMTVEELKKMWAPESAQEGIKTWSQIRAGWPDKEFHLFGPGTDSGTYDYFTEAVVGKARASRGDFTASEDDNVLVQGVSTDQAALGFFGYAYYLENEAKLKVVPIDDGKAENGQGPITPSMETVSNGTYQPLSRPIFIYVNAKAADERPELIEFVNFTFNEGRPLVKEVGYIPLPDEAYKLIQERISKKTKGSMFQDGSNKTGAKIEDLLRGGA